jgi:hypothetical protein
MWQLCRNDRRNVTNQSNGWGNEDKSCTGLLLQHPSVADCHPEAGGSMFLRNVVRSLSYEL